MNTAETSIPPLCLSSISVEADFDLAPQGVRSKFDGGVLMRQHATHQWHEHACIPCTSVVAVCPFFGLHAKLLLMQSGHL